MDEIAVEKVKNVTYEPKKMLNRIQEQEKTLETFHAAFTAQTARSDLETSKKGIVTDLLNSRMGNARLQDTLTVEALTPEEALKRATMFKNSEQTTSAF